MQFFGKDFASVLLRENEAFILTFLNKTSLSVRSFQALCSNGTQLRYLQKTSLSVSCLVSLLSFHFIFSPAHLLSYLPSSLQ
ncbi:hypothetical protein Syun_028549 [Stephania yunnanensis]|uniref:Uncharacterized protein n=1 Tax=Stephania yunnanensis TaxID=152371 RepID=A0AAP0E3S5_9MAGN